MYKILKKRMLCSDVREYVIEAPQITQAASAGQFIVLRLHEYGERIPLTIANPDSEGGSITLVVQEVGKTTKEMGDRFDVGDTILDVAGPLGIPSEVEKYGTVICIGGGLGIAPVYPIACALREAGNEVIGIIGARNKDLLFYIEEMNDACNELIIVTDDGSTGRKGFTSDPLQEIVSSDRDVKHVWAVGPAIMMKVCSDVTRESGTPTTVSLNSVMIDGTGMCGGCRVKVAGKAKFACVDGPEFDGHKVDFDLLMERQAFYEEEERCSLERYLEGESEKE